MATNVSPTVQVGENGYGADAAFRVLASVWLNSSQAQVREQGLALLRSISQAA